jgi:hypothetical protein
MRVRDRHAGGAPSQALAILVDLAQEQRLNLLGKLLGLLLVVGSDKNEMGRRIIEAAKDGVAAREHEADMGSFCSPIAGEQDAERVDGPGVVGAPVAENETEGLPPLVEAFHGILRGAGCGVGGHQLEPGASMARDKLVHALFVVPREDPVQGSERLVVVAREVDLLLDELLRNLPVQVWRERIGEEKRVAPQALVRGSPDSLLAVAAEEMTADLLDRRGTDPVRLQPSRRRIIEPKGGTAVHVRCRAVRPLEARGQDIANGLFNSGISFEHAVVLNKNAKGLPEQYSLDCPLVLVGQVGVKGEAARQALFQALDAGC